MVCTLDFRLYLLHVSRFEQDTKGTYFKLLGLLIFNNNYNNRKLYSFFNDLGMRRYLLTSQSQIYLSTPMVMTPSPRSTNCQGLFPSPICTISQGCQCFHTRSSCYFLTVPCIECVKQMMPIMTLILQNHHAYTNCAKSHPYF